MPTHLRLSPNFMKKSLSLLHSPYFISILLFLSSLLYLVFHTLKVNFSASFLFSALKFSFDRNYMFLICNGILVILVKSSSSSSSSSLSSPPLQPQERKQLCEGVEQSTPVENLGFFTVGENSTEELESSEFLNAQRQNEEDNVVLHDYEEEEEEEGLAAEEFNKRCEEFIRRMKLGIISESTADPGLARFY